MQMDNTERLAWINLALVKGVGPKAFRQLFENGISPTQLYEFGLSELESLGFSKKLAMAILKHPPSSPSKDVEEALAWQQRPHHHLVIWDDPDYPEQLKHIDSPPPLLMVKGRVDSLSMPQLAIVGSRYPTQSGQAQAFEFAQGLADAGLVITSGLARGVDAYAHKGALQSGGLTIAVLGTGLKQIYPKSNQRLADEISETGALVSEFALSSAALTGHFPRRNRIVSGLSLGTLVVEATLKSGSLITARQALEQNREVFALPGALSNPQKSGCHYLIRQGAELIEAPEQIMESLNMQLGTQAGVEIAQDHQVVQSTDADVSPEQYAVLSKLDYEGTAIDELVRRTQLSIHDISVMLMDLELSGLIRQEQGLYARV